MVAGGQPDLPGRRARQLAAQASGSQRPGRAHARTGGRSMSALVIPFPTPERKQAEIDKEEIIRLLLQLRAAWLEAGPPWVRSHPKPGLPGSQKPLPPAARET